MAIPAKYVRPPAFSTIQKNRTYLVTTILVSPLFFVELCLCMYNLYFCGRWVL